MSQPNVFEVNFHCFNDELLWDKMASLTLHSDLDPAEDSSPTLKCQRKVSYPFAHDTTNLGQNYIIQPSQINFLAGKYLLLL